jgi:hypothetical protein
MVTGTGFGRVSVIEKVGLFTVTIGPPTGLLAPTVIPVIFRLAAGGLGKGSKVVIRLIFKVVDPAGPPANTDIGDMTPGTAVVPGGTGDEPS